jgi:hypothetical protein
MEPHAAQGVAICAGAAYSDAPVRNTAAAENTQKKTGTPW